MISEFIMHWIFPFVGMLCLFGAIVIWQLPRPTKIPNMWTEDKTHFWLDTGKFDGEDDMRWWMTIYHDKPLNEGDVNKMIERLQMTKMKINKAVTDERPA